MGGWLHMRERERERGREREVEEKGNKGKRKESVGDLSGGVGTLKFLCEIFSITPYLSLAVGRPFPLASSCPLVLLLAPAAAGLQLQLAPLLACTLLTSFFCCRCCFCSCRSCSCVKS